MKEIESVTSEHLHTFHSEKIGIQHWYLCSASIEGETMHYTIFFDHEDLYDSFDGEKDSFDDEDIENYASELAYCTAEVIASNADIAECREMAHKSIDKYNNGAFIEIDYNGKEK